MAVAAAAGLIFFIELSRGSPLHEIFLVSVALAVAAMWRETLGVQTRLRNEEWKVFVGTRRQRVITQVFRGGWIADIDDARNFLDTFRSDSASNWSGHDDPAYDALLDAAAYRALIG